MYYHPNAAFIRWLIICTLTGLIAIALDCIHLGMFERLTLAICLTIPILLNIRNIAYILFYAVRITDAYVEYRFLDFSPKFGNGNVQYTTAKASYNTTIGPADHNIIIALLRSWNVRLVHDKVSHQSIYLVKECRFFALLTANNDFIFVPRNLACYEHLKKVCSHR
jgi:hypothetical protein